MKNEIWVIVKKPGLNPELQLIDNTLGGLQGAVCGYIETVTLGSDACMIVDEDGKLDGSEFNFYCPIMHDNIYGPVVLAGVDEEEFTDWPISFATTKNMFSFMWEDEHQISDADFCFECKEAGDDKLKIDGKTISVCDNCEYGKEEK